MAVSEAPPQGAAGATPPESSGAEAAPATQPEATPVAGTSPTPSSEEAEATTAAEATPEVQQHSTLSRRDRERLARAQSEQPAAVVTPAEPAPTESKPAAPAPSGPTPEQIIAEFRRTEEARVKAEAEQKAQTERYAQWTGAEPADPKAPDGPTLYAHLQGIANQEISALDYAATQDEFDAREKAISEKNTATARLNQLNENRGVIDSVRGPATQVAQQQALDWTGQRIEQAITNLGLDVPTIIKAGAGNSDPLVPMLVTMAKTYAEQQVAPVRAENAELKEDNATLESDNAELRRQLGGAAPGIERGGVASGFGSTTRDQFLALPKDQKDKIRRESPELLGEIYSRSA